MLVWPGFASSSVSATYLNSSSDEAALREEGLGVAVRLDADREDDQVVLGLDQLTAVLDVLVAEDEVAVRPSR